MVRRRWSALIQLVKKPNSKCYLPESEGESHRDKLHAQVSLAVSAACLTEDNKPSTELAYDGHPNQLDDQASSVDWDARSEIYAGAILEQPRFEALPGRPFACQGFCQVPAAAFRFRGVVALSAAFDGTPLA